MSAAKTERDRRAISKQASEQKEVRRIPNAPLIAVRPTSESERNKTTSEFRVKLIWTSVNLGLPSVIQRIVLVQHFEVRAFAHANECTCEYNRSKSFIIQRNLDRTSSSTLEIFLYYCNNSINLLSLMVIMETQTSQKMATYT